jgi:hypothetical protein
MMTFFVSVSSREAVVVVVIVTTETILYYNVKKIGLQKAPQSKKKQNR